jgi:DNA repair exonuclease SbcCD ATPase subunit
MDGPLMLHAIPQGNLDNEFDVAQQQAEMLRAVVAPMEEEMEQLRAQLKAARAAAPGSADGGGGGGSGGDPADKEHIEQLERRIAEMGAEAEAEHAALEIKLEEATRRADAATIRAEATEASLESALRVGDDRAAAAADDSGAIRGELVRLATDLEQAHADATKAANKLALAEKSHQEHLMAANAATDALRARCKEAESAVNAKSSQVSDLTSQLVARPHVDEVEALQAEIKALKLERSRAAALTAPNGDSVEEEAAAGAVEGGGGQDALDAGGEGMDVRDTDTPEETRRALASLQRRLEDMQTVLATKTVEHTETMERLTAERDRIDALETELQGERKARKGADHDCVQLTEDLQSARSDLLSLQTRATMAAQDKDALAAELEGGRSALATAQAAVADLRAQLDAAALDRTKREADAIAAKQAADGVHAEMTGLKAKLTVQTRELEETTRTATEAKEKFETLRQTHTAFKEEHADMRARCDAAAAGAAEAKAAAEELVSLRAAHEGTSSKTTVLQGTLREYKELLEEIEAERSELRTQVKDQGRYVHAL